MCGWWQVCLDYSVISGPFLRFSMRFEFLSEMYDHSVCETKDLSLTIDQCVLTYNLVLVFGTQWGTDLRYPIGS